MPTFDNNENLASIRTKINDAITMTENHDTSKMPTAPDDGNSYIAQGSSWVEFSNQPPLSFTSMVMSDARSTSFVYPQAYGFVDPLSPHFSITLQSGVAPLIPEFDGVKVFDGFRAQCANSAKVNIYKKDDRWQLTHMVIAYVSGNSTAQLSTGFSAAGHTFGLNFQTDGSLLSYLAVAIGTSSSYAEATAGTYGSLSTGWHVFHVTYERDVADTKWIGELWVDGVSTGAKDTITVHNEVSSSAVPTTSNFKFSGDPNVKIAAQVNFCEKKSAAEVQALFDQFKADNAIV